MSSLKDKTISGVFWSFGQKFGAKGVSIVTTLILARLLTPKDFGLVAMLAVFISISEGIASGGFNQALIQKKGTDDEDYSTVFYINLAVSFLLYGVMYFSAPLIADFYDQPQLISLTRVLAFVFVINSFSYVQKSRLAKEMKFKTLMLIHLPSTLISAVVAITMAYLGYGVWSLVAQQLVQRGAYAIQIWLYAKWKPLWSFNTEKARSLFAFGSRMLGASILDKVYQNIYVIVIGKFFPVNALGYYKNADNLTRTPANTLSSALKAVTFPAFSSIQDDNKRLKKGYKKAIQQVLFWVCPVMVIAAVLATPLFRFVLTEKWLPAVPYFRILCIFGIIASINSFNVEILTVKGYVNLFFKLKIVKKLIITILVVIAIPLGIWALIWSQVLRVMISYTINSHYSGKFIDYPLKEQLKDIFPIFALSVGVGACVFGLDFYISSLSDWLRLLLDGILGVGLYGLIAKFAHFTPYQDINALIGGKLKSFFKSRYSTLKENQ